MTARCQKCLPGRCQKCDRQACLDCRRRIEPELDWEKTTYVIGDCRDCGLREILQKQADLRVRLLGFEIGQVVEFTATEVLIDPGWRGRWVVTGSVPGTDRIELDRWPREQVYTAVEAWRLKVVA